MEQSLYHALDGIIERSLAVYRRVFGKNKNLTSWLSESEYK